jgi:hypothetical protein
LLVDSYKLAHWMNVRKVTPERVAADASLDQGVLTTMLERERAEVPDEFARRLVEALHVAADQLAAIEPLPAAYVMTAAEVHATRRPIQRDGIHFYNYYSMAGAPGAVAPVILDILCPADRLPQLNNGHLEPAITVNLGPGDINGRWGTELNDATWSVLRANRAEDPWIVGDSYVEPSYCPHTYSLASDEPARIISYTAQSNLDPVISELNRWPDHSFEALLSELGNCSTGKLLGATLRRRGFDAESAAAVAGISEEPLRRTLAGEGDALSLHDLRKLGDTIGFDYRIALEPLAKRDAVGKTYRSIEASRDSIRGFRSYTVASMASAPHLPDLTGCFMSVSNDGREPQLDLSGMAESHYFVLDGNLRLWWIDEGGEVSSAHLGPDGTAWVAPFVAHGWTGSGSVAQLGSGRPMGYLDLHELGTTFQPGHTLRRGRRDATGWGYDSNDGG